jgi:DNA-binding response OmpR family regulator
MTEPAQILVVDDDPAIRALLRGTLEIEGYAVGEAASGEQMFSLLEQEPVSAFDAIMDLLKGQDWAPLDRSIDALVGRLRKKIEPDPDHPPLIKTVRGSGCMFAAEVTRS